MTDFTGKISKTKIKELCLKCLEDNGFHPINVKVYDGFGKSSEIHFKIKEIPYWLFALWIRDDKGKKEYTIEFFGEKEDWIDKFKPSQTTISSSKYDGDEIVYRYPYVVTNKNKCHYFDVDFAVWSQMDELHRLKKNRRIAEYGLSDTNRSFLKWLWEEIMFYDIEKPLTDFYEDRIQGYLYKAAIWFLAMKYRKYIKARPVEYRENTYPSYSTGIEYLPNLPEEIVKKIWFEIEDSKLVDFLYKNSNFCQYANSKDNRGFYYDDYKPKGK